MTDLTQWSAVDLSARLQSGALTSVDVMSAFLDRIDQLNPTLNAIVSLRARADLLADAKQADQTPRKGWLHGLPMAIKDLSETMGIRTTFGSPLFADYIPTKDDLMVQRLKQAGAIIIGKTNTPEYGLGSHTFNPVHGPTRNPYAQGLSAGGSSGGAAVALAARMLPLADGSDMMGSLRNPAAFNNVYGFRPSLGVVPSEPQGEVFLRQLTTNGPMARSPRDIAALLGVMAGPDPRLPYTVPAPDLRDLNRDVTGRRIGWLGDWGGAYPVEDGILPLCKAALSVFADLGCIVEPVDPPFDAADIWQAWTTLRSWDTAASKAQIYADPAKRGLLKPDMIWEIEQGLSLTAADIHHASAIRSDWFRAFVQLCDSYDALVLPSAQVWPFPIDWTSPETINDIPMDTYHRWMEIVVPVSLIGVPALAIPAGFGAQGLPMGMQMFARRGADRDLLALGHAYHQQVDWTVQTPDL